MRGDEDAIDGAIDPTLTAAGAPSTVDVTRSAGIVIGGLAGGSPDLTEHKIGRYRVLRRLGEGGMGVVYEAEDPSLDRRVALKLLRPRDRQQRGALESRLAKEARALARLQHPNVVAVYDTGGSEHGAFVVMQLVEGEALDRRLARGPLPWREAVAIVSAAGRGLAAAHAAGIVHRDVKPSNILVDRGGTVRVGDFGLARSLDEGLPSSNASTTSALLVDATQTGAMLGTPRYMAPEQHLGQRAAAGSDQFSLCVTLYEALYGAPPFVPASGDMALALAAMRADALRPLPRARRVPRRIDRVLRRGLRFEPDARWPSMDALLAALAPRRRWPLALGVTAVVALSVAAVSAARSAEPPSVAPTSLPARPVAMQLARLTRLGDASFPEVSPDGRWLAYLRDLDLYVRDLHGEVPDRQIASNAGAPRWSPASDRLAVRVLGEVTEGRIISVTGEVERVLPACNWRWSTDDELLCYGQALKEAVFYDPRTGATRRCRIPGEYEWLYHVAVAPRSGRVLAVTMRKGDQVTIWTFQRDCSDMRALLIDRNRAIDPQHPVRWSADGDAVLVPKLTQNGGTAIEVVPLAWPWMRRVVVEGLDLAWFSVGPDGALYHAQTHRSSHVWRLSPRGEPTRLSSEQRPRSGLELTSEATAVTFVEQTERGFAFVHQPLDSRPPSTLLAYEHGDGVLLRAVLSTDQQEIATIVSDGRSVRGRVIARAGASPRAASRLEVVDVDDVEWSGGQLFLSQLDHRDFLVIGPDGERRTLVSKPELGWVFSPVVSPNGRMIAVGWNQEPHALWTIGLHDRVERRLTPDLYPLGWSRDGAWIYAATYTLTRSARVPVGGGAPQPWLDLRALGAASEAVSTPDGGAVVLVTSASSDLFVAPGVAR